MLQSDRRTRRTQRPLPRKPRRPRLEPLEERQLLANIPVTSAADTGPGTLRQAITNSNALGGSNTITFNIGTTGSVQTIALQSALPAITTPVTIDGLSQGGAGYNKAPLIVLNGANANGDGFDINASNTTIKGLAIDKFANGISISSLGGPSLSNVDIEDNYIGLDNSGVATAGNTFAGIEVWNSSSNTISNNVISANGQDQVQLYFSDKNLIQGNLIGTVADGSVGLSLGWGAIHLFTSSGNTIGGTLPKQGNVLASGTAFRVLELNAFPGDGGSSNNLIEGNKLGTNLAGTATTDTTGLGVSGILLDGGSTGNTIGGTAGAGNVIAGLTNSIISTGSVAPVQINSPGNLFQGNLIGLNAQGNAAIPNHGDGVVINAPNTTIGGTVAGAGNFISGNTGNGITVTSAATSGILIAGNDIGIDAGGTNAIPNGTAASQVGDGIKVQASGVVMGDNVISGNAGPGIEYTAGTSLTVLGNYIGTSAPGANGGGLLAVGNGVGILIDGGSAATIGGTALGAGNVISGNAAQNGFDGSGISITNSTGDNLIAGNLIGTDDTGTVAVPNAGNGIAINGSSTDDTIGGTAIGAGNVISGNGNNGIVEQGSATGLTIQGNAIGTDVTGTVSSIGNGFNGIELETSNNLVGGSVPGASNIIAYNGQGTLGDGVWVNNVNAAPVGNVIQQNSIHDNAALGISLSPTGILPTPIAPPASVGSPYANNHINYPTITQAIVNNGATTVTGLLTDERPNTTYNIDFYENATGDASTYGEGQTLIGTLTGVQTDSNGAAPFLHVLGNSIAGDQITATVTDASQQDGTSEFSKDIPIQALVNLSISVNANPNPVYVNQDEVYTVTVTNNGTTDAHNVQIIDNLPNGLSPNVSAVDPSQPPNNQPIVNGTTVTDSIPLLPAGQTETMTITVIPLQANVPSMTDTAVVTTTDDNTNNQSQAAATVTVKPVVPLAITVTPNPVPALVGQNFSYTVTLQNLNPTVAATGVVFTDTLDPNLIFTSATASDGSIPTLSGTTVTDSIPSIPGGKTVTLVINTTPLPTAVNPVTDTGSVTNSASETYTEVASNAFAQPSPAPLSAVTTTAVNPVANVTVSFAPAPSPNPAPVDQPLTYTLVVSNNGPSTATNLVVSDVLDPNVTFLPGSSTPEWNPSGQTLTDKIAQLAAGNSVTLVVVVTPSPAAVSPLTDTGTVANAASVTAKEMTSASTATSNVTVSPVAVLTVTGKATPNKVNAGSNLVYTFTVTNTGPSTANDILFTDPIPLNATFVSANDSQGLTPTSVNNTVMAKLGTLAPGANAIVTITLSPTGKAGNVGSVTNTASVTADESPAGPSPSATVTTQVIPASDVSVSIQASPNPDTVGQPLTYVITAANAGPSDASDVVVTDTLDLSVTAGTITMSQGTSTTSQNALGQTQINADLGAIAAGATATVTVVVTPTSAGSVTNNVSVANTPEQDLVPGNNSASVSTTITPAADLSIQVTGTPPGPVLVGSDVEYTATATNNGPSDATGVTITDTIPLGATFVTALPSAGGTYSISGAVVTAYFPTLSAASGNNTASLQIDVIPSARGTMTDTASVSAVEPDPSANNNTMSVSTTVQALPGTFDFLNPTYTVNNNAGYATITVIRTNGLQGDVKIPYTTTSGSAKPGLDYTPVSGTLDFPDGVGTATFTVPVLAYPYNRGDIAVGLALGNPAGGAILGPQASAELFIHVVNPDLTPPTVTGVAWYGVGARGSAITVNFSKPMNAASVTNVYNYQLVNTGTTSIYGARGNVHVAIAAATYNPANNSVLLVTAVPLRPNLFYHLNINGSVGAPITDIVGNVLAGNGSTPGTDDALYFASGARLNYTDAAGNQVSFRISGGGFLNLTRFPNGEANNLQVVGEAPHRTTLIGTINRGGTTVINSITGLGSFGDVNVRMTTPPFYITVPSYTSLTPAAARPAVATPVVTTAIPHDLHRHRGGAFPRRHR